MGQALKKSYSFLTLMVLLLFMVFLSFKFNLWKSNRIIVDAPSYYTYLPAFILHHDLQLKYIDKDPAYYKDKIWFYTIKDGKRLIKHPPGLSVALSPFFLMGHLTAKFTGAKQDGYSKPYQNAMTIGVWCYLFLGLFFLRKYLLIFFSEFVVSLTLLALLLATNLLWYSTFESIMPHAVSFALFCAGNYYFFNWLQTSGVRSLLLFSICFALGVLIRPLAVTTIIYFLIVLVGEKQGLKNALLFFKAQLRPVLFALILSFFIVSIQFIYWKYATGNWLFDVYVDEHFIFDSPQILPFLFSFRKGVFIYSPILLFALLGFVYLFRKYKTYFWATLVLMCMTIYLLASWWAWSYGISWGIRPMIDYFAFLAFPLAAGFTFFDQQNWKKYLLTLSVVLLTALSLFQTWQYKKGLIHYDDMSKEAYLKGFFQTTASAEWVDLLKPYNWKRRIEGKEQITYNKDLISTLKKDQAIYLRGFNQKFVSTSKQADRLMTCYYSEISPEELFYIEFLDAEKVAIRSTEGKYLSLKKNEHRILVADSPVISDDEKFILTILDEKDNCIRLQTLDGKFLSIGVQFPYIIRAVVDQAGNNETFRLFLQEDYQGN
ncbi:MAG: hypothetical protein J0L87_15090 [Bacteroidetes bacterium]|nr:hypothetical protein [Bacteroidota bacterium]